MARRGDEIREWTFFVDGFLSWTRREREILVALAAAGARLEIALCLEDSARVPFAPARRTLAQLRGALDRAGIVEEPRSCFDAPSAERAASAPSSCAASNAGCTQRRPSGG